MSTKSICWVMFLVAISCGGATKSSEPTRSGHATAGGTPNQAGGAASANESQPSGMPGWVARGNVAVRDGTARVFYGVGSASGIRNPSMLRSTADNRARNEIAKVFEVFSASLMKDYAASSGEQSTEQAVKTFTSMSLEGVQVVDRYIAGDGTMYALAVLDLGKVLEGVRKAKELGAVKSYVDKVSVDDIFDQHSKKPEAPKRVVAQGNAAPAVDEPASPPAASATAKVRSGGKPAWIDGEDPNYRHAMFLCAVGYGSLRPIAENGSYAALSRVFQASVVSVAKDLMAAYSATGSPTLEVSSSEQVTKVSTSKVFSGVQVMEVWEGGGTTYALACLDRARAGTQLRQQIGEADKNVGGLLDRAGSADKTSKVAALGRALSALIEREALNGELRIVDVNGVGVGGEYSHADVAAALEEAVQAVRIGIRATGAHASDFRSAIMQGLTNRGWEIAELPEGDDDDVEDAEDGGPLDVEVAATIRMENAGKGGLNGAEVSFVRGVVQVQVKNVAKGKVIATMDESRKEGHRSIQEAERRAVREIAKKLVNDVASKIDDVIKGKGK